MSKKGFAETYFLVIFLTAVTVILILVKNQTNRLQAAENIKQINQYLAQEAKAIAQIKDSINEEIEKEVVITLTEPLYETIIVEIDVEHQCVYDYTVIRDPDRNN